MFSAIKEVRDCFKKSKGVEKYPEVEKFKAWTSPVTEEGCKHDWETVVQVDLVLLFKKYPDIDYIEHKWTARRGTQLLFRIKGDKWGQAGRSIKSPQFVNKKVCLTCGECVDESIAMIAKMDKIIATQKKEMKIKVERQAMAKKMWLSCEKGVT